MCCYIFLRNGGRLLPGLLYRYAENTSVMTLWFKSFATKTLCVVAICGEHIKNIVILTFLFCTHDLNMHGHLSDLCPYLSTKIRKYTMTTVGSRLPRDDPCTLSVTGEPRTRSGSQHDDGSSHHQWVHAARECAESSYQLCCQSVVASGQVEQMTSPL